MPKIGEQEASALRERVTSYIRMQVQLVALDITVCITLFAALGSLLFVWSREFENSIRLAFSVFAFIPCLVSIAIFWVIVGLRKESFRNEAFLQVFAGDRFSSLLDKYKARNDKALGQETRIEPLDIIVMIHRGVLVISCFLFGSSLFFSLWTMGYSCLFNSLVSLISAITLIIIWIFYHVPHRKYLAASREYDKLVNAWQSLKPQSEDETETG